MVLAWLDLNEYVCYFFFHQPEAMIQRVLEAKWKCMEPNKRSAKNVQRKIWGRNRIRNGIHHENHLPNFLNCLVMWPY